MTCDECGSETHEIWCSLSTEDSDIDFLDSMPTSKWRAHFADGGHAYFTMVPDVSQEEAARYVDLHPGEFDFRTVAEVAKVEGSNDTESKRLTITLTGRPPVRIPVEHWPVIAEATARRWDGEHEFQSFRKSKASIRVRQHQDGRTIVYGSYSYDTSWQGERSLEFRGGVMLDENGGGGEMLTERGRTLVEAVEDVAEQLGERIAHAGGDRFGIDMVELGQKCIADLPAQEI